MGIHGSVAMEEVRIIIEGRLAFLDYVRETYGTHPIGALIFAVELYEGCRRHSDSFFWDIMATQGDAWDSQKFLNAAMLVIAVAKEKAEGKNGE